MARFIKIPNTEQFLNVDAIATVKAYKTRHFVGTMIQLIGQEEPIVTEYPLEEFLEMIGIMQLQ
ncbi:MAG: hypothetical protein BGO70_09700 [Bacteroidetes bacterium 43-93]|nr:hypothetical protein [Bacteroidota bacterium]OJX00432.1 MAG: hypothetical protein BGO70_09700 [Bacteroidetes bacterium 43-93]